MNQLFASEISYRFGFGVKLWKMQSLLVIKKNNPEFDVCLAVTIDYGLSLSLTEIIYLRLKSLSLTDTLIWMFSRRYCIHNSTVDSDLFVFVE